MLPNHPAPSIRRAHFAARTAHKVLATVAAMMLTVALSCALVTSSAEAATKKLTATAGRTTTGGSLGNIRHGTTRAAFTIPASRPSTMKIGLDLRRQTNGNRYQAAAKISKSGVVTVMVLRYRGSKSKVLKKKTLALRVKSGQTLWLEGSISGNKPVTVKARVWLNGKAKPGWQQTVKDKSSQRVMATGKTDVVVALAAASSKKKVAVTVSNATVEPHKPAAGTTGVPAGTKLRVHKGNIVVTKAGTRLDRMDIHGFVRVKAPNVTIANSIVRGGKNPTTAQGVITNYGYKNLLITDTDVRTSYPSVYLDGIKGWDFTARRVHVVGGVDSIKIHGDNVTIADSLLENTKWFASDPYQKGGPTHNDNVQILKGRNLKITGNTIRGAQNFAVLGAANQGAVPNLTVRANWLDGGHCTLKLQTMHDYLLSATVTDNLFGPNRKVSYCPIQSLDGVTLTARNNVSELTGEPVQIWRKP